VRIVGTHSGIGVGEDGYSQMACEDIAAVRALPNVAIVNPGDAVSTERATEYLVDYRGPAFLRLTRQKVDDVHDDDFAFEFGKAVQVRDGSDVAILATGATLPEAVRAADALRRDGITARVLDVHTIKPLDEEAVLRSARDCGAVVTVEDHSVHGGLGGAVAEVLATRDGNAPLRILGVRGFGESGTSEELYAKHGIDAAGIARSTSKFLNRR
jgi:transketolase